MTIPTKKPEYDIRCIFEERDSDISNFVDGRWIVALAILRNPRGQSTLSIMDEVISGLGVELPRHQLYNGK